MKEFELLKIASEFFRDEDVEVPATMHDAAYVRFGKDFLVLTCDTVNEMCDFPPQMLPEEFGHLALAVTLSDLAACGANPLFFLNSITLRTPDTMLVRRIFRGMKKLAKRIGIKIVGGDIDRSNVLSITGFAVGHTSKIITRSGAKPGEKVYITDVTGKAELSIRELKKGKGRNNIPFPDKVFCPEPRIQEGIAISKIASTLTDISDSLAISLHNISKSSGVAIELDISKINLDPLEKFVNKQEALNLFLYGGGDYELLFTAKESDIGFEIGEVTRGESVYLNINGRKRHIKFLGYSHF